MPNTGPIKNVLSRHGGSGIHTTGVNIGSAKRLNAIESLVARIRDRRWLQRWTRYFPARDFPGKRMV